MMLDIRVPPTLSQDPREAAEETRRFLFQLCEQLNKGIADLEKSQTTAVTAAREAAVRASEEGKTENRWNEIKSLIIKSADIVTAFSEEISQTLSGEFVAQSEFGTYQQEIENRISLNSDSIESRIQSLETINSEWYDEGGGAETVRNMEGVIRAGVLYTDESGNQIVGVEVGERMYDGDGEETFNKFARFTSDRLSFYDAGGNELAYFSDQKLHITEAEILESLKLGHYLLDQTDGLAFIWED